MPLSKEKGISIAVFGLVITLLTVGAIIIIQYPEVLNPPEKPALQILDARLISGWNEGGTTDLNASLSIEIKNTGTSNESKMLVCSITFRTASNEVLKYDNRTLVSLAPGETRTYFPVIILPESAKNVDWNMNAVLE